MSKSILVNGCNYNAQGDYKCENVVEKFSSMNLEEPREPNMGLPHHQMQKNMDSAHDHHQMQQNMKPVHDHNQMQQNMEPVHDHQMQQKMEPVHDHNQMPPTMKPVHNQIQQSLEEIQAMIKKQKEEEELLKKKMEEEQKKKMGFPSLSEMRLPTLSENKKELN